MTQEKDVLQSKTFYGLALLLDPGMIRTVLFPLISAIITALNGMGMNLGNPADYSAQLEAVLSGIQTAVGGILGLWGLLTRKAAIGSIAGIKVRS